MRRYVLCSSSPPMAKMFVRQTATLRYARRCSMLETMNHVPELAPDVSNARVTLVAVPSLSGLSLRYTAPPVSRQQVTNPQNATSYAGQAHSPAAAGDQCAMHSCVTMTGTCMSPSKEPLPVGYLDSIYYMVL